MVPFLQWYNEQISGKELIAAGRALAATGVLKDKKDAAAAKAGVIPVDPSIRRIFQTSGLPLDVQKGLETLVATGKFK